MRLVVLFCVVTLTLAIPSFALHPSTMGNESQHISVVAVDIMWNYLDEMPNRQGFGEYQLKTACSRGFNKIRFAALPFWPDALDAAYFTNQTGYWSTFDTMVAHARQHGCRLIPSLFWNWFGLADATGTPLGAGLRNNTSPFTAALVAFIKQITTRYGRDDTIVAWELGNELNLLADLNMTGGKAGVAPSKGTPTVRSKLDNFSTTDMIVFESYLADTIRTLDPLQRPVSTGHAVPRLDAEHLRASYHAPRRDWAPDTVEEFQQNLQDTCKCCEWCSVHVYSGKGLLRFGNHNETNPAPLMMPAVTAVGQLDGKRLYLGEFGDPQPGARPYSHTMVRVLPTLNHTVIPFATIWVWEFYQRRGIPSDFSLVIGRDDAFISELQDFNSRTERVR